MKRTRHVQAVILFLLAILWIADSLLLATFSLIPQTPVYALSLGVTPTPAPTPSPDAVLNFNGNFLVAIATVTGAVVIFQFEWMDMQLIRVTQR